MIGLSNGATYLLPRLTFTFEEGRTRAHEGRSSPLRFADPDSLKKYLQEDEFRSTS